MKRKWRIATEDEIAEGKTTDVYFERTVEVLEKEELNPMVRFEVTVSGMPEDYDWGIVAGVDDILKLMEGKNIDIYGMPEGTLFKTRDYRGVKTPIISIEGPYQEFAVLETPMLGFLCHTSGMVTKTAHVRLAAGDKTLLSFGARRTHPAITPQVEYAAYIGGCDGVSCVLGGDLLGLDAVGTMPHALIIAFQDQVKAWLAFDRHLDKKIPRTALVDTYLDEVVESIMAAENIDALDAVRVDTPGSRRGDFIRLIQEVRWELDIRGFKDIKIFASGGLDEGSVKELRMIGVDGFGVGGAISNSPAIDFAADIVAIHDGKTWKPAAKRGKFSGRKTVWRCRECPTIRNALLDDDVDNCHVCGGEMVEVTTKLMEHGKILREPKAPKEIRDDVLDELRMITDE